MADEIVLRVAMKALIVKDGKVLVLREARTYMDGTNLGKYQCPGGRVEPGEHFEDALRREIREETGLEVEIGQPIFVGEWRPVIRGVPTQIIGTFFVCTPSTDKITVSEEHDDYKWIDPKEHQKFNVMDPENQALDRYAEWVKAGKI